jgi:hypothetical protein
LPAMRKTAGVIYQNPEHPLLMAQGQAEREPLNLLNNCAETI